MTTTIENVISGLRSIGYKVSVSPQEKISDKEVIITIEDLEIEVETSQSYFFNQTYAINWYSDDIVSIATAIPVIMGAVEVAVIGTARNFKFINPEINREGTAYLIGLKFSFTETIST